MAVLWDAYGRIEPFGGEYHRHAVEMEVLDSILAVVVNKSIPSSRKDLLYRPRDRDAFMPSDYVADKPKHKRKGRTRSSLDVFVQSIEMRSKIKSEGR